MDNEAVTNWALAAQSGDHEAAAAFVRSTTPALRRLLHYLCDPGHVEDLVQETYLRAFAALPSYAGRASARVWLFSIARRVAADHVRKSQRSPRTTTADPQYTLHTRLQTPGPAGIVELRHAIATLEPPRREAFVLTRILGLSYAEAAQACACPVGTIRSRVARARTDLHAALADEHDHSNDTTAR